MKIIRQGSYINYVRRIDENTLESGAMLVSTDFEFLIFETSKYKVLDWYRGISAEYQYKGLVQEPVQGYWYKVMN